MRKYLLGFLNFLIPPLFQVEIHILDVNDHRPEFEVPTRSIWVAESAEVGSVIYGVRASDEDSGDFGRIDYRLLQGPSAHFQLDPKTGDIRLLQALDYEKVKRHRLLVGASDFGLPPKTSNCTVLIEVQDVNDNSPKFREKVYHLTVLESLPLNSHLVEVSPLPASRGLCFEVNWEGALLASNGAPRMAPLLTVTWVDLSFHRFGPRMRIQGTMDGSVTA